MKSGRVKCVIFTHMQKVTMNHREGEEGIQRKWYGGCGRRKLARLYQIEVKIIYNKEMGGKSV